MPTTTSATLEMLVHDRIAGGLEQGIRLRGDRPGYQVRVYPFGDKSRATALEALALRDELAARRDAGVRTAPHRGTVYDPTLAEACEALLAVQAARLAKGDLRDKGERHYRDATRVWRGVPAKRRDGSVEPPACDPLGDGRLFAELQVSELEAPPVYRYLHRVRQPAAAVAARNELQVLKKTLELAERDGARVDPALRLLELDKIRRDRKRDALSPDELETLVASAPGYAQRLVALAGTVGNRVNELFTLTDDRVDLEAATMFVPAELCKERRDKTIPLLPAEVRLVREQLLARATGTRLVFPKREGGQWRHSSFGKLVWGPARRRAARTWREETGAAADVATPFEPITTRTLRRTASTLMRQAGLDPEFVAARLGHSDGGALMLATYRAEAGEAELRRQLDRVVGGDLLAAARAAGA